MIGLFSLPLHILVDITSYLDTRTIKAISPLHSILRDVCDIHLYRKISLPLSNPYLRSIPIKPSLARSLEEQGWIDDIHQTGHLDASLKFLAPLLEGRTGFVRELSIDLKHRYHDNDMDLDTLTNPSNSSAAPKSIIISIDKSEDPPSELDLLRLQASLIRQRESPLHLAPLAHTFSHLPTLPAVTKLSLTIYESFPGYLPYLFAILPNLTELVLEPHQLLVESPLSFPSSTFECILPRLRKLRVEPMLNSLQDLVGDLLRAGNVEELVLGGERWTMDEELAGVIKGCGEFKKTEVGKRNSKVLLTHQGV